MCSLNTLKKKLHTAIYLVLHLYPEAHVLSEYF